MSDRLYQHNIADSLIGGDEKLGADPSIHPYRTVECHVCGKLIPEGNLAEHLMADARIIKIINEIRPEWNKEECEAYLKSMSSSR